MIPARRKPPGGHAQPDPPNILALLRIIADYRPRIRFCGIELSAVGGKSSTVHRVLNPAPEAGPDL
ncbi:hypothetical protein ACW9HR_21985 [Nocardia gipuzkoensis]